MARDGTAGQGQGTGGSLAGRVAGFVNSLTFRNACYQLVVLACVVGLLGFFIGNAAESLERQGIATGFGFLQREAGFDVVGSLMTFRASETYLRAFAVGLSNTLTVSLLGILLATFLGFVVGLCRLSRNLLVNVMAQGYVEVLRNVPLVLQLFIWYTLSVNLPSIRNAISPLEGVYLSQRGLFFPTLVVEPVHQVMLYLFLAGVAGVFLLRRQARRRHMQTGVEPRWGWLVPCLLFLPAAVLFVAAGMPAVLSWPELRGFNFQGGGSMSPEFISILMGLSVYTSSFVVEIFRAGVTAIPKGQTEAGLALGLSGRHLMKLVVLPQALRVMIPPLTSQYLNLTKNSSLAVAIGYADLTSVAFTTTNQTGQAVEAISIMMAIYLSLSLSISLFMNWWNRRAALVER